MSDLSNFGAGVDQDAVNPEDDVNKYLSQWLRGDGRSVYWDREKSYGNGTFNVTTRRRPDLLITGKNRNYVVEVKRSEDSSNIHDGSVQAFGYWRDLVSGQASYSVRGKTVDIDAVLLASDKSPEGKLFHSWNKKDVLRSGRSDGAKKAVKYGQIPEIEHSTTETLIRVMHRFAKDYDDDAKVGIGGLLSSCLDGDGGHIDSAEPAALYYAPGNGSVDGKRVQNWDYIPFYLNK